MRSSLARSIPTPRTALAAALLLTLAATSGCAWFRKGHEMYAQSPENRPLEVPPDLDRPGAQAAMGAPAPTTASATAPAPTAEGTAIGFITAGSREDVYAKVDAALAAVDGAEVASRAAALGVFDVNYQGSNFLVRVSAVEAGAYVSAVDPRGMPATGDAPTQLIAALRSAIGGN